MQSLRSWLVGGIALVMAVSIVYVGVLQHELKDARADFYTMSAIADSTAAANDTTRVVAGVLADSLRLVQRRAIQTQLKVDQLDKKLAMASAVRVALELKIDSLEAHTTAVVTSDPNDSIRSAVFTSDSGHVHMRAAVNLPHAPGIGTAQLNASIDAFRIGARVGCGTATHANPYRPATLSLVTPLWVSASIDSVSQDPDVCNAHTAPTQKPTSHTARTLSVGALITLAIVHFLHVRF